MRNFQILVLCVLTAVFIVSVCVYFMPERERAIVTDVRGVVQKLQERFPAIGDLSADAGPLGLLEITVKKSGEVFYSDTKGEYIFLGNVFDKDDTDITAAKARANEKSKWSELSKSLDRSIAVKIGSGKKEVVEFTDVDCPYCKQAESFFINADVTRYVYFYPLDSIHPDAALKSEHILCSSDPAAEYQRVINGEVTEYKTCENGQRILQTHRNYASQLGVKGTPLFFIDGETFSGADTRIIEAVRRLK